MKRPRMASRSALLSTRRLTDFGRIDLKTRAYGVIGRPFVLLKTKKKIFKKALTNCVEHGKIYR